MAYICPFFLLTTTGILSWGSIPSYAQSCKINRALAPFVRLNDIKVVADEEKANLEHSSAVVATLPSILGFDLGSSVLATSNRKVASLEENADHSVESTLRNDVSSENMILNNVLETLVPWFEVTKVDVATSTDVEKKTRRKGKLNGTVAQTQCYGSYTPTVPPYYSPPYYVPYYTPPPPPYQPPPPPPLPPVYCLEGCYLA